MCSCKIRVRIWLPWTESTNKQWEMQHKFPDLWHVTQGRSMLLCTLSAMPNVHTNLLSADWCLAYVWFVYPFRSVPIHIRHMIGVMHSTHTCSKVYIQDLTHLLRILVARLSTLFIYRWGVPYTQLNQPFATVSPSLWVLYSPAFYSVAIFCFKPFFNIDSVFEKDLVHFGSVCMWYWLTVGLDSNICKPINIVSYTCLLLHSFICMYMYI